MSRMRKAALISAVLMIASISGCSGKEHSGTAIDQSSFKGRPMTADEQEKFMHAELDKFKRLHPGAAPDTSSQQSR